MEVREGGTDAQIVFALRQWLPHLTDPVSLHTTTKPPTTQPALLSTDGFPSGLGDLPPDDWSRTWVAGRTIILRRTSKRVKEVVDKMRLPAVVHLSRSFWDDVRNGTETEQCSY
jgi:hypothetical protein